MEIPGGLENLAKKVARHPVGRAILITGMLGLGASCANKPPEPSSTPNLPPAPTATPRPADITDVSIVTTAETQDITIKEIIKQIGLPTSYRPATKEEVSYFTSQDGQPPLIKRLGVKKDATGNLLIPVYPDETILGKAPSIPYLRSVLPEDAWLSREQEVQRWVAALEEARDLLASNSGSNQLTAENDLKSLQNRIEFISGADKARGYNTDGNKNNISDYAEGIRTGVISVLGKLPPVSIDTMPSK